MPVPVTVRPAAKMITADKLQRHVTFLASPELNGRSTPSAGLDKAAGHLVQYLSEWRVRPLGDDGTYLQHYAVQRYAIDTVNSVIQVGASTFRYGDDFMVRFAPRSVSVAAPAAFVGDGLVVRFRLLNYSRLTSRSLGRTPRRSSSSRSLLC